MSKKLYRIGLALLGAGLSVSAHAGLQLSCPVQWDQLNELRKANPNATVMGVQVKDWTPALLEQVRLKSEECMRTGSGPESLRRAAHMDGMSRMYPAAEQFLAENAERDQQAKTVSSIVSTVNQSDLKQVIKLDTHGRPVSIIVRYRPSGQDSKECDVLDGGVGFATVQSLGQVVQFARLCQKVGLTEPAAVALLERQASGAPALYKAIDAYAAEVKQLSTMPKVPESRLKELEVTQKRISAQIESLGFQGSDNAFVEATQLAEQVQKASRDAACGDNAVRAGFPAAWRRNYVLVDMNSPQMFCRLVQVAQQSGAQVRYLSGGLISKEGFEVKSAKRTVQVFSQSNRLPGGDPDVQLMVPVQAKIDGKSVDVTRGNLRAVGYELLTAVQNH